MQVLEKVARAVSRNYGVKVVFKGRQVYTDGKTIVLPTLPVDLDETDEAKVRGYCDHEIGHIVFTDMKAYKAYAKQGKRQADVLNLVEDLWIEKHLGIKYPGAKVNMEKTAQTLHAEAVRKMGMKTANEHILAKIWVEGRRQNAGFSFPDPDMTADIKKVFGDDFFKRLAAVDSTNKAVALAKHIVNLADTPMPKSDGGSYKGDDSKPGKGVDDPKESDSGAGRSSETKGEKEIKDENEGEVEVDLP